MIKVLLKHCIYEFCIDRLFKGIYNNFDICERKLIDYKVGQYIPHLQLSLSIGEVLNLYKCKLVYKKNNKVVLECGDGRVPTLICAKDNTAIKIIAVQMAVFDDYEELFENEH